MWTPGSGKVPNPDVLANKDIMEAHLQRYRRAPAIGTVFGFVRGVPGFVRWQVRGSERVAAEASLFKTAYHIRKRHRHARGPMNQREG